MAAAAADAARGGRAGAGRHRAGGAPRAPSAPLTFVAALLGALFIQIGTNLSNDYSRRPPRRRHRGPARAGAGDRRRPRAAQAGARRRPTWRSALAVLRRRLPVAIAGWELLLVGVASILAGVLYTGGPRPYGYEGLGEVFVFLFFGVVAVAGSYFVQTEDLRWEAFALGVPVGLLAAAILVVNNVRDLETDRRAGKRTLAVRLGRERARMLFVAMVVVAFAGARCCSCRRRLGLAAAAARGFPPRAAARAHRQRAHRRPGAQRRARRHRARCSPSSRCCWPGACCSRERAHRRSVLRLSIPLREPFVTSSGVVSARELLLLRLEARDGTVGYGEAAPLEPYDGVPLERARRRAHGRWRAPRRHRCALPRRSPRLDLQRPPGGSPARRAAQARAAGEHDAHRRAAGGGGASAPRAGMREGYACFKVKVGLPDDARARGRGA